MILPMDVVHPEPRRNAAGHLLCDSCERTATWGWQRVVGDVPQGASPWDLDREEVPACDIHTLDPDLAGALHLDTCQAPPTCTCDPVFAKTSE